LRYHFLFLLTGFAIKLCDLFVVWPQQRHDYINPSLLNYNIQVLPSSERDLVSVTFPASYFALDTLTQFELVYRCWLLPMIHRMCAGEIPLCYPHAQPADKKK
jgi:hypothetical protein